MFVDTFIRRPILASVCSLVIILAGAIAIPTLPIAQYPQLAPPQVSVTAFYTGANAQAVETAVTTPLEQAINGVEGMLYMTSSSTNSGVAQHHRHVRRHARPRPRRRRRAEPRHPGARPAADRGAAPSASRSQKQSTGFVLAAGVYSEKGEYDSLFISNYVDVYVKDALKRVPGVGDVHRSSASASTRCGCGSIPTSSPARELTAGDVVNALREQNVQVAAGSVGAAAGADRADVPDQRARRRPAAPSRASSRTSS